MMGLFVDGVGVNLTIQPPESILPSDCSYSVIHTVTPVACGVMCGGGIGDIDYHSDQLQVDLSIGNIVNVTSESDSYNVTISVAGNLTNLFHNFETQVFVNSQKVDWNAYPPSCVESSSAGTTTYGFDCLTSVSSHLTFEIPNLQNGTRPYQILVDSSETLVP